MNAARMMLGVVSLNKALLLCGVSKKAWYYVPKIRDVLPDPEVLEMVQKIFHERPTYGTRRMAAQVSRKLYRSVNRGAIRRIFKMLGRNKPARTKREIIRANKKPPRPKAPNQFWESDMSYIWCGVDGWSYCFNVVGVFTRQWLAFILSSRATRHEAIMAVNNAVAVANPKSGLTLRVGNGSQYARREFRSSRPLWELPSNTSTSTRQNRTDTSNPSTRRSRRSTSGCENLPTSMKPKRRRMRRLRTTTTTESTLP